MLTKTLSHKIRATVLSATIATGILTRTAPALAAGIAIILSLAPNGFATTLLPTPQPSPAQPLVQALTVVPNSLNANIVNTITLTGDTAWKCNTQFSHDTAVVNGKRINLSFSLTQNPQTKCVLTTIYPPPPVGPKFLLPKLSAGSYEVWTTEIPTCAYSKPACLVAYMQKYAGVITVADSGTITYSINPTSTVAGKDFSLDLLSYQFNCANTYDMLTSSVLGDTISLTFLDHEPPAASICPAIYKPYGPTFKMKALKSGTYLVKAFRLPACAAQGCKMAAIPANAGILTVTDTLPGLHIGWYLKEKSVAAEKPFALKLLNQDYGNCQTTFSHQSVRLESGTIWLSFLIESHPERLCITDIHPNGPTFDMTALNAGEYPVEVMELFSCQFTNPMLAGPQPICFGYGLSRPTVDTLIVSKSVGINFEKKGSNKNLLSSNSYMALNALGTKRVQLILPPETLTESEVKRSGAWTAQLISLNGEILESHSISKNKTEFESERLLNPNSYYIKLTSTHGISHTFPLIQKN